MAFSRNEKFEHLGFDISTTFKGNLDFQTVSVFSFGPANGFTDRNIVHRLLSDQINVDDFERFLEECVGESTAGDRNGLLTVEEWFTIANINSKIEDEKTD